MTHVLDIAGLHKRFDGVPVLAGLDLALARGDIFGLIGPNGSGKSTLLDLICGADRADAGTVCLAGRDLAGVPAWRRVRLGIGRCFQDSRLWSEMTAGEHLLTVSESVPRLQNQPTIDDLAATIGLSREVLGMRPPGLNLLQRRRLELTLAAFLGSQLLLLDELGSGLDIEQAHQLYDCVVRLLQRGCIGAVVMVEHRMELVAAHAGAVGLLQEGRLRRAGREDRSRFESVMHGLVEPAKQPTKEMRP